MTESAHTGSPAPTTVWAYAVFVALALAFHLIAAPPVIWVVGLLVALHVAVMAGLWQGAAYSWWSGIVLAAVHTLVIGLQYAGLFARDAEAPPPGVVSLGIAVVFLVVAVGLLLARPTRAHCGRGTRAF